MRKRSISRGIMLLAGFIAVCVIMLSPSFSHKEQVKNDKETVLIQAPADAIPGSAVKLDQPAIPLLTLIEEQEPRQTYPLIKASQVTRYLKLLFRTLISPNAP